MVWCDVLSKVPGLKCIRKVVHINLGVSYQSVEASRMVNISYILRAFDISYYKYIQEHEKDHDIQHQAPNVQKL